MPRHVSTALLSAFFPAAVHFPNEKKKEKKEKKKKKRRARAAHGDESHVGRFPQVNRRVLAHYKIA